MQELRAMMETTDLEADPIGSYDISRPLSRPIASPDLAL